MPDNLWNPVLPHGFPSSCKQIMFDKAGQPAHMRDKSDGVIIQVHIDHDQGILSFDCIEELFIETVNGFPKGAALRPFAYGQFINSRLEFVGCLVKT